MPGRPPFRLKLCRLSGRPRGATISGHLSSHPADMSSNRWTQRLSRRSRSATGLEFGQRGSACQGRFCFCPRRGRTARLARQSRRPARLDPGCSRSSGSRLQGRLRRLAAMPSNKPPRQRTGRRLSWPARSLLQTPGRWR